MSLDDSVPSQSIDQPVKDERHTYRGHEETLLSCHRVSDMPSMVASASGPNTRDMATDSRTPSHALDDPIPR